MAPSSEADITLKLSDSAVPALQSDQSYIVTVTQEVVGVSPGPVAAAALFTVAPPRYGLSPGEILQRLPAAGQTVDASPILPMVMLARRGLPWEVQVDETDPTVPWLALIVATDGSGATAAATLADGAVSTIAITTGGNGYAIAPPVVIDPPPAGGTQAVATALLDSAGAVSQIVMVSQGSGYQTAPLVTLGSETGRVARTLAQVLTPENAAIQGPQFTPSPFDSPETACQAIDLSVSAFALLMPRQSDLPFLAHVRHTTLSAGLGDEVLAAAARAADPGWHSLVLANQLPPAAAAPGVKLMAHLVSLQGWYQNLAAAGTDAPILAASAQSARLISLAAWSFTSVADAEAPLGAYAQGLLNNPGPGTPYQFVLPIAPANQANQTTLAQAESELAQLQTEMAHNQANAAQVADAIAAVERQLAAITAETAIADGYTALPYTARSGETTFGWYRGPFAPILPQKLPTGLKIGNAAALMAYDQTYGVFDLSYAVAFETGRLLALSDGHRRSGIMAWRREARGMLGAYVPRAGAAGALGSMAAALTRSLPTPAGESASTLDGLAERLLALDSARPLLELTGDLAVLDGVPFNRLVPNAAMLPTESIRFFYVDPNWIDGLIGGALSVGNTTAADSTVTELIRAPLAAQARREAGWRRRRSLERLGLASTAADGGAAGGFLLRSGVIEAYPNLETAAYATVLISGQNAVPSNPIAPCRLARLGSNMLLGLYPELPQWVSFSEPNQGLHLGLNGQGFLELRSTSTGTAGQPLTASGSVYWVAVTAGGQGYQSAPAVAFSSGGATATAIIAGGTVTGITVTAGGSGYSPTAPPDVTFTGGGGSGAAAQALVLPLLAPLLRGAGPSLDVAQMAAATAAATGSAAGGAAMGLQWFQPPEMVAFWYGQTATSSSRSDL